MDWEDTDALCLWLCEVQQYTIDYAKTGTPIHLHEDVAKEINKAINPRQVKKPSFMRVVKETEDEARRKDNNRCVREMLADGKEPTRKHQTKKDTEAHYEAEPNADRTMGKIEIAVNNWRAEHIPDGLGNLYIEGYNALVAPRCCSDETRAALLEACKAANSKTIPYQDRVNTSTAIAPNENVIAAAHKYYDQFDFNELLDIALNEQKGSNAFAAILILHKDKFVEYCNSPSRLTVPGDYFTTSGHQKYSHKLSKEDIKKGAKKKVTAMKESCSKPVYCINEDEEIVYYNKSQSDAAAELEMKRPNLVKYINDNTFHKVKSKGMKLMFIEDLDEYIIKDRLAKGFIVVVDEDGKVVCAAERNKDIADELEVRPAAISSAIKDGEFHQMKCWNKKIKFLKES